MRSSVVVAAGAAMVAAMVSPGSASGVTGTGAVPTTRAAPVAPTAAPSVVSAAARVPRPAHVVVVVLENKSYRQVMDPEVAPYVASLARRGAVMTRAYARTHPSQPNYLILFSGSRHGVRDNSCPNSIDARNLGSQLRRHGYSFAGYAESLPEPGWTGCSSGPYARRHAPWVNFANLPPAVNLPMTAFPTDYDRLPTVAFVVPNLDNDMHDGTVRQGDDWLRANLGGYARWARTHDSLLIVTFDEDDGKGANRIPTVLYGADVAPGRYRQPITHCSMLRTLEAAYDLPKLGCARKARVIKQVWTGVSRNGVVHRGESLDGLPRSPKR